MKRLLGGTLVFALGSLLTAAPQTPPAEGEQTPSKQTGKKSHKQHSKTQQQTGGKHHKSGKPDTKPSSN